MGERARPRRSALCAPALAALLLAAAAAVVRAQDITFTPGSAGCTLLQPTPPFNLAAVPGDGSVLLTWDRPRNGACVSEYLVSVRQLSATRSFGTPDTVRTPDFRLEISNLQNGVQYEFTVQAVSPRFGASGLALVRATPRATPPPPPPQWPFNGDVTLCASWIPPSAPTDLHATPAFCAVKLCWKPPANLGCVSEYRVTARRASQQRGFGAAPFFVSVNKGGCVDLTGLDSGAEYIISVESYSQNFGAGGSATVRSTPR